MNVNVRKLVGGGGRKVVKLCTEKQGGGSGRDWKIDKAMKGWREKEGVGRGGERNRKKV